MEQHDATALPAMSYITVEPKPLRPTEAQIKRRAHHIWVMRDGAPGNAALDWLEAEMELTRELATRRSRAAQFVEAQFVESHGIEPVSRPSTPSEQAAPAELEFKPQPQPKPERDSESQPARHAA